MYTAASSLSLFLGIIRLISFLFYYYKKRLWQLLIRAWQEAERRNPILYKLDIVY